MPRKKKQVIKTNNNESLEGLLQETYNDACKNITQTQETINKLETSIQPVDVDETTKIAKEKTSALKIKDSAIKLKLEIAKLQSDIIKHSGNAKEAIDERSGGTVDINDFRKIRKMLESDDNETKE